LLAWVWFCVRFVDTLLAKPLRRRKSMKAWRGSPVIVRYVLRYYVGHWRVWNVFAKKDAAEAAAKSLWQLAETPWQIERVTMRIVTQSNQQAALAGWTLKTQNLNVL
jgi:hypothetical protein